MTLDAEMRASETKIDPDVFTIFVSCLAAVSDLITIVDFANDSDASEATPTSDPFWRQVREMKKAFGDLFEAFDDLVSIFSRYEETFENKSGHKAVGFGTFLANLDGPDFDEFKDAKHQVLSSHLKIGHILSEILRQMNRRKVFVSEFSESGFIRYHELNEILHSELSYSELVLKYRDIKDRVERLLEGAQRRN